MVEAVANPYAFTGREYDGESGLYYYRARTYDPASGRFLQEDPLELGQGALWKILAPRIALPDANSPLRLATSDLNLYRYAGNNPLNAVDPAGTSSLRSYAITAATTASAAILATISRQEAVNQSLSSGLSGGLSRLKGFLSGVFGSIINALKTAFPAQEDDCTRQFLILSADAEELQTRIDTLKAQVISGVTEIGVIGNLNAAKAEASRLNEDILRHNQMCPQQVEQVRT